MNHFIRITIVFSVILLAGCNAAFKNISGDKPYSSVVGLHLSSKKPLILHGWTDERHWEKEPVLYSFSSPPGASNRFVKSRERYEKGVKLVITDVYRCTNCFLDSKPRIKLSIKPVNFETQFNKPVYLDADFLVSDWSGDKGKIVYSSEYFQYDF